MTIRVTPVAYQWVGGYPAKVNADVAAKELERIAARDREIVPQTLVDESRPDDAPLHDQFEWDDNEAAQLYREDQARQLIRSLKVVYVRNDTEEPLPPVRAYVNVVDDPALDMYAPDAPRQRHYRPIVKVMGVEDLRDQYRRQAFEALCAWRDRYHDIEDFAQIFAEIDAMRTRAMAA